MDNCEGIEYTREMVAKAKKLGLRGPYPFIEWGKGHKWFGQSNSLCLSNPPKQEYICIKCGEIKYKRIGKYQF